ncbi:MAG: hypothetical protein WCJ25_00260 [Candidatus Moraniibacteriota bacterium]
MRYSKHCRCLETALASRRPEIDTLLSGLKGSYHNGAHAVFRIEAIGEMTAHLQRHERLESDTRLLLETCALMLDLGRSGFCGIPPSDDARSYEERAEDIVEILFDNHIPRKAIWTIRDMLKAYPSRWNDYEKGTISTRMATSKPKRILGLSDVFSFARGWDSFLESAFRLAEECPQEATFRVDGFIRDCETVLESFVRRHLVHMKNVFEDDYYFGLLRSHRSILASLKMLRENGPERESVQERLYHIECGETKCLI